MKIIKHKKRLETQSENNSVQDNSELKEAKIEEKPEQNSTQDNQEASKNSLRDNLSNGENKHTTIKSAGQNNQNETSETNTIIENIYLLNKM